MGDTGTPRILGERVLAATRFLEFKQISYLNRLGMERKWDMVARVGGRQAVMIVPFCGEKLVVTREFRVPIGDYEYSFPAGLIDDGETPEAAARREMREETGLEILEVLAVSPPVYNTPGLSDEAITMLYARVGGTASRALLEPDEDIETLVLSRKEVAELMNDRGKRIGAKAWVEFYHFVNDK